MDDAVLKEIVDARDYQNMVPFDRHPEPGEYVITGLQAGNHYGEKGWHLYVGYVVQVRKKSGAYGSDLVILRHPDGTLMLHHNQSFYRMDCNWSKIVKDQYPDGITPELYEDYTEPYTLGGGEYPETGKVTAAKAGMPIFDCGQMVMITTVHADGTKVIENI